MKLIVPFLLALTAPSIVHATTVHDLCAATIHAYASAWDQRDVPRFATLFAEDSTLDLGQPVKGKAAIVDLFRRRINASTTRHIMSNIGITSASETTARGTSYLLLFSTPGVAPPPIELPGYSLMAEYDDVFVITEGKCLIASRKLVPIFRRARPASAVQPAPAPGAR